MLRTQTDQIPGLGQATCSPVDDVMHHDVLGTAARNTTALITMLYDPAGPLGDHPLRTADTELRMLEER